MELVIPAYTVPFSSLSLSSRMVWISPKRGH